MDIVRATFTTSKFEIMFKMMGGTWTYVTITTHVHNNGMEAHIKNTTVESLENDVKDLTVRMGGTYDDVLEVAPLARRYWNDNRVHGENDA